MFKNIWYYSVRFYVKIGLFFTLKKINVFGKQNIPKKGAVLFVGNHQNALIDAALIPTTNNRNTHFLTRASVFKNPKVEKILRSLNLIPVYRIRDGFKNVEKNNFVFEQCVEYLKKGKAIEIFAEGEHHHLRSVIPFKKGFARIILGTLQKYPDLEIKIVPVGINYDSHLNYPCSSSIYYGKPIIANDFIDLKNPDIQFKAIIEEVRESLKKLTLHINNTGNYQEVLTKLKEANVDFLNPIKANNYLKNLGKLRKRAKNNSINWFLPIHILAKINSIFPLLIWGYLKPKIKDILFTNTYRFGLILTVFPLFYLLQTSIIHSLFGFNYALIYLACTILIGIITTKTARVTP